MPVNSKIEEFGSILDGEAFEDAKLTEVGQEALLAAFNIETWARRVKEYLYKSSETYFDIGKWLD